MSHYDVKQASRPAPGCGDTQAGEASTTQTHRAKPSEREAGRCKGATDGYAHAGSDKSGKLRREIAARVKSDPRFCEFKSDATASPAHIPAAPRPGETSAMFPEESRFIRSILAVPTPAGTDNDAVEEEALVLGYTTRDGKHDCELWWKGGDGGTPLLAYLVDSSGAHFLPQLSQLKEDGERPYATLEEARTRFMSLAEAYYAAAR